MLCVGIIHLKEPSHIFSTFFQTFLRFWYHKKAHIFLITSIEFYGRNRPMFRLEDVSPCLTKGVGCNPPYSFFLVTPKRLRSDLGHIGNLFDILFGHFDENKLGVPPYLGSEGEGGFNLFQFMKFLVAILKNICIYEAETSNV